MLLVVWFIINGQLVWLDGWHPIYFEDCPSAKKNIEKYLELVDAPEHLVVCIPTKE